MVALKQSFVSGLVLSRHHWIEYTAEHVLNADDVRLALAVLTPNGDSTRVSQPPVTFVTAYTAGMLVETIQSFVI